MKGLESGLLGRRDLLKATAALAAGAKLSGEATGREKHPDAGRWSYHQVLDSAPWSARYGLGLAVFQERLWVIGGSRTLHDGDQINDVWSSADGLEWRQELASAPWQPRWNHALFAFASKLWVIGGLASVTPI